SRDMERSAKGTGRLCVPYRPGAPCQPGRRAAYNTRMSDHADVLILGGGVIGLTTAYFLADRGARVTLLDQGDLGQQASWAGAGIIPPGDPAHARTDFELLRTRSAAMYPDLSARLRDETGIDNGYVVCGGIELPDPADPHALPTEEWHAEGTPFLP